MQTNIKCVFFLSFFLLRVSNQNGVSPLYIMLEIHRSGREPSLSFFLSCIFCFGGGVGGCDRETGYKYYNDVKVPS